VRDQEELIKKLKGQIRIQTSTQEKLEEEILLRRKRESIEQLRRIKVT